MCARISACDNSGVNRFGYAHGIRETTIGKRTFIRSAAEAKNCDADRLECEAWNAIMWAGGQIPSPGNPQAEPIGKAINGGFDLLEARHNRCDRVSILPLRALKQPEPPVWKPEASLFRESCSAGRHCSQRQHILGLSYARPDPTQPAHRIAFDPHDFLFRFVPEN